MYSCTRVRNFKVRPHKPSDKLWDHYQSSNYFYYLFPKYYFHLRETFFLEKKLIEKKRDQKRGQKGVERGQKGSPDPLFQTAIFLRNHILMKKINTCDMMLGISPCISAYKFNEIGWDTPRNWWIQNRKIPVQNCSM